MNNGVGEFAFANIAKQLFGQPLLLAETQGLIIGDLIAARIAGNNDPQSNRFNGGDAQFKERTGGGIEYLGYRKDGNVATINIHGELVNRGAWMGASSGLTSYEGINQQIKNVANDPEITKVILDVNSPGGEATNMQETARAIRELSVSKEVIAVVNGQASSAAYGLVSAASQIYMGESSSVGSIGVLVLHMDQSKRMKKVGVSATFIHAGSHKVDGNPFGPLKGAALENIKARVETVMDGFVFLITDHRENLNEETIRGLEARVLLGKEALEVGLVDGFATYDEVLEDLKSAGNGPLSTNRSIQMPGKNPQTNAPAAAVITQNDVDAAVQVASEQAKADGIKEGAAAATSRFNEVMSAKGVAGNPARVSAAFDLACKSPDMSAADVAAFVTAHSPAVDTKVADAEPKASLNNRVTNDGDDLPGSDENPDKEAAAAGVWDDAIKTAGVGH